MRDKFAIWWCRSEVAQRNSRLIPAVARGSLMSTLTWAWGISTSASGLELAAVVAEEREEAGDSVSDLEVERGQWSTLPARTRVDQATHGIPAGQFRSHPFCSLATRAEC